MFSFVGVALAALACAGAPAHGDVLFHEAPAVGEVYFQLPGQVGAQVLGALPPPPGTVIRDTYFGKVTIDHSAHLRRRSGCATCHGPGPVRKIAFTPKIAHERCVGCHKQVAAGPTTCTGCHVKPPVQSLPAGVQVAGAPAASAGGAASPGAAPAGAPRRRTFTLEPAASDAVVPVTAGAPLARSTVVDTVPRPDPRTLRSLVHVGWSGGGGTGPSLGIISRDGDVTFAYTFDRVAGDVTRRQLGMMGAGVSRQLDPAWRAEGVALGGFDYASAPRLAWMPVVGARASLEWRALRWLLFQASLTGIVDLSGKEPAGKTAYATVSTGFELPPRAR